jgi:hypothetical protein
MKCDRSTVEGIQSPGSGEWKPDREQSFWIG